jgi:hypothetical protein
VTAAEVEELLAAVAPHELRESPAYVVRKEALPDHLGGGCDAAGWTTPTLDLELREVIGDRWRGRGACVVASGSGLRFEAVALHEFAHALDRPRLYADPPRVLTVPELAEHNVALLAGRELTAAAALTASHGPAWCRLVLHLTVRAGRLNHGPMLADVFGYEHLLPYAYPMFRAIVGELEHWHGRPLAALDRVPLPPPFLDLWHQSADWCRELEARSATPPEE